MQQRHPTREALRVKFIVINTYLQKETNFTPEGARRKEEQIEPKADRRSKETTKFRAEISEID